MKHHVYISVVLVNPYFCKGLSSKNNYTYE